MSSIHHVRGTRAATSAELAALAALQPTDAAWDRQYEERHDDDAWDTRYPLDYPWASDNEIAEECGHRDREGGAR